MASPEMNKLILASLVINWSIRNEYDLFISNQPIYF